MDRSPPTFPPITRGGMPARPWHGLLRGLLVALLRPSRGADGQPTPAWLAAARRRRRVLLAAVLAAAVLAAALAPAGLSALQHTLQSLLLAWVAAGCVTALMGGWVLLRGDRHALRLERPHAPIDRGARTAIVMPVCNEHIGTVFGGLQATCESLAATGALDLFDVYLLSDSSDPALRAAELAAWQRLRQVLGDDGPGTRIFYRWRRRRTKRKAGNVADFCRRWGRHYRYMVVLDADSTMQGETLVALVRLMEQHPRAGIVQTLPQGGGCATLHARAQQFASRVTGRLFALGMAYWQLGESHYWGHNAILRVEPFMRHCALAPLPGRGGLAGEILSHDFVEAALMRRAGYEVWLAPALGGSWEQHPPDLLAELQRDRRWCQGNLQNARLAAEPGWRPAHRAMFATGALSYTVAPLWLLFVGLGLWFDAPAPQGAGAAALWGLTVALLLLPRVLGVASVVGGGEQQRFGGSARLVASALLEALLSALQAPVRMLAHSVFVLGALTGLRLQWRSPPRDAAGVRWRDAARQVGLLSLPPLVCAGLLLPDSGTVPWHLALLMLPLLLGVPFAVVSGSVAAGRIASRLGLLGTPEDAVPPRTLQRAAAAWPVRRAVPAAPQLLRHPLPGCGVRRAAMAFSVAAACLLPLWPQPGTAPGLPATMQAEREQRWLTQTLAQAGDGGLADTATRAKPQALRERPARRIDNAVRRRALEAVARALAEG